MEKVGRELNELGVSTFLVNTKRDFGAETVRGLGGARCMVAFCNSSYGEKTSDTYETYCELKHAYENKHDIDLIPVQLCPTWPPQPKGDEGKHLCNFVLGSSKVRIKGIEGDKYKPAHKLAADIRDHIEGLGVSRPF